MMRAGLALVVAIAVGACGHPTDPTPAPDLPALQRPLHTVATSANQRPSIPRAALVLRGGVPGVFVMDQGLARFRMVRPGAGTDDAIEISSGLFGDERLVIGELDAVHDGSPIQPINP